MRADGQTNSYDESNSYFSQFCNRAIEWNVSLSTFNCHVSVQQANFI
jgi:beta-glucanase (GH16 family)